MVSEIFGPNEIESLYSSLEKIGWDKERIPVREESNVDWLKNQRLYGSGGNLNIGLVHRFEDIQNNISVRYTANYPAEFSHLLVRISQLTPSITCVTVGFVLNEKNSLEYAEGINEPAQTSYSPIRGSGTYSIVGVEQIKKMRIAHIRQRYRTLGISWVSKNLPGFFSEYCRQEHFPTTEMLLLEGFTPFDDEIEVKKRSWLHWSRFVNVNNSIDSWTCSREPSLKFSFRSWGDDIPPNHMTVALRTDTLKELDIKMSGNHSLSSCVYFAHQHMCGIIPRYALIAYLSELLRYLKQTRQFLSIHKREANSISDVEQISSFFRRSIGVPSIANEVVTLSNNDASFRWDSSGFSQKNFQRNDETIDIKDWLKSFLNYRAQRLLQEDRDTREFLNQLSSALGTKESVFAQRRMELVAWLAFLAAAISTINAVFW